MSDDNLILGGLYIYKDFDPFSDGVFKSVLMLNFDEDDSLSLVLLSGYMKGMEIDITYQELMKSFISVRSFLETADYIGRKAFRNRPLVSEKILDFNFTNVKIFNYYYDGNVLDYLQDNTSSVKQVVLYQDKNNMLIYYNSNSCNDYETRLCFINSKYINADWCYLEEVKDLYSDLQEIILDLYTGTQDKNKKYLL